MIKFVMIAACVALCSPKLSVIKFQEQLDYPGIQTAPTRAHYTIEIDNPKEKTIEVDLIWVRGKYLSFTQTEFSSNPIKITHSGIHNDPKAFLTNVPSGNKKHQAVVCYRVKGKKKVRFLGVEQIEKVEPIARP